MAKLYNLARMTTATTGTGTITLGSAASGSLTFAQAGVANGETVSYAISDGANAEVGIGVYTSSGTTLTRTVISSTNSNTAINLSGSAEVFITCLAEDFMKPIVAKTTTYTATARDVIAADTSGGAWTLTLPASPVANDTVHVFDAKACFSRYNLTIAGNSSKINGLSNISPVLNEDGMFMTATYVDSTYGWVVSVRKGDPGTTYFDLNNTATNLATFLPAKPNDRRLIVPYSGSSWGSIKSSQSRTGKNYFEVVVNSVAGTYSPIVGVGYSSASVNDYAGSGTGGGSWGVSVGGTTYGTGSTSGSGWVSCTVGDVIGVAVDDTASTGSIKFYKNNSNIFSRVSLTMTGAYYIMISANTSGAGCTLRTKAEHCSYSAPAGYSYWDN